MSREAKERRKATIGSLMNLPKTRSSQKSYYYSLGGFVDAFSWVEVTLHAYFFLFANIDEDRARAIKRNAKAGELIAIIKALIPVMKYHEGQVTEILELFRHFEHIAEFRDRIIHRGGRETAYGEYYSSNAVTTRSNDAFEEATFTIRDIKNATSDLKRIAIRLSFVSTGILRSDLKSRVFAPWRYKPVVLKNPYRVHQTKLQTPPHRR